MYNGSRWEHAGSWAVGFLGGSECVVGLRERLRKTPGRTRKVLVRIGCPTQEVLDGGGGQGKPENRVGDLVTVGPRAKGPLVNFPEESQQLCLW